MIGKISIRIMKGLKEFYLFSLLVLLSGASISCRSSRQLDGTYKCSMYTINISGDRMKISFDTLQTIIDGSTISICKMAHIKDNFYSLNSLDVPFSMFENADVEYIDRVSGDSATVIFKLPNYDWAKYGNLKITVEGTHFINDEYTCVCDSDNYVFKFPNIKKIQLDIAPMEYVSYTILDNHHGMLRFMDLGHRYDVSKKDMIITLPNVSGEMINRWYLHDVIIQVNNNSITLFGNKFDKVNELLDKTIMPKISVGNESKKEIGTSFVCIGSEIIELTP